MNGKNILKIFVLLVTISMLVTACATPAPTEAPKPTDALYPPQKSIHTPI